jgi:hypothetical protein
MQIEIESRKIIQFDTHKKKPDTSVSGCINVLNLLYGTINFLQYSLYYSSDNIFSVDYLKSWLNSQVFLYPVVRPVYSVIYRF